MATICLLLLLAPRPTVEETEAKANKALTSGDVATALLHFEQAIRLASDNSTKLRLRDAYRKAGWAEPRPIDPREQQALDNHQRNEKARVWRAAAGRFLREGKRHACILARRQVRDLFGPKSSPARNEEKQVAAVLRELTKPTEEDNALAAKVIRTSRTGQQLLKKARRSAKRERYGVVVRLCQELEFGDYKQELQNEAVALRREIEERAAAAVPKEERKEVEELVADERFKRLAVVSSRHFLFLGPKKFVESIPATQRNELDLAYIFQSDLASQQLTLNGVRIVVYYQETFDFGGALATTPGKLIRVGSRAIRLPVAGFLHYHELGHCVLGKGWLHHGFTEGLADFAAGFTMDCLGQTNAARQFITGAREQFVRFYLGREMHYHQIQPYRPAAGFLFSLLPAGEAPYDWQPYRRVFERMREAQFGHWPEREHQLMRYFGYLLATEYGPGMLEKLEAWGFPVSREDFRAVEAETIRDKNILRVAESEFGQENWKEAEQGFREVLADAGMAAMHSRARHGLLRLALREKKDKDTARLRAELGIVDRYRILGPFHAKGRTADVVLQPETRPPDFENGFGTAIWKKAKVGPTGYVDLTRQGYGYPENACAFAVTHAHVAEPTSTRIWLGSDDGHLLQLNGALIDKRPKSHRFRWDDHYYDVKFRAGWNRILLKVHNRRGPWGFMIRLTTPRGNALTGLELSNDAQSIDGDEIAPQGGTAERIVEEAFKGLPSRWIQTVGKWDTQNSRLRPLGTEKRGLWNRFVVDPDKPASGPANLIWLRHPELVGANDLRVALTVDARTDNRLPARFGITLDGEPGRDVQSGHTLVFRERDKKLMCEWYRYDQLLYLQPGLDVPPASAYRIVIQRIGRKWWVTVNGLAVFDRVDAARLPAFAFGLSAWGAEPLFSAVGVHRLVTPE
ncbi:MAG: hypothetical protein V3T86_16110 [Planctomycetota bacterium]